LAMIDMAEDGDNRWARNPILALFGSVDLTPDLRAVLCTFPCCLFSRHRAGRLCLVTEVFDHNRGGVIIDLLIDRSHDPIGDQFLHHLNGAGLNQLSQFSYTQIIRYEYNLLYLCHSSSSVEQEEAIHTEAGYL